HPGPFNGHINEAIRALPHIPYSSDAFQQLFPTNDFFTFHIAPLQIHKPQRTDEHITFPLRIFIAGNESHAAWSYGWSPEVYRLLHSFFHRIGSNDRAIVINAVSDFRPSVIG